MTREEKREKIKIFIKELMQIRQVLREEGILDEERESEIYVEIDKISPDPEWDGYIGGSVKDENGNFISEAYYDKDHNILMDKFLDKIFSYQPIIMGYIPIKEEK